MGYDAWVSAFLDSLSGKSPRTYLTYKSGLARFREFLEARDTGTGSVAAAAEYGLAAALWNQGKTDDFKRFVPALLARPVDPAITPNVLAAAFTAASVRPQTVFIRTSTGRSKNRPTCR